ncbi:aquaporin AQPAe.a isoform X2 [Anabrus simplex]|uniref:aquaporin AQPAe.a isoform X2 n=1 Tax=Anabrus simplex TaxID=316456 RepID=UPI0035A3C423
MSANVDSSSGYITMIDHLWDSLKRAFRRSEDGSFFGQFSTCQALTIGAAELLGTAFLVLLGCMSLVKGIGPDEPPLFVVAFGFGFAVAAIIQIIGHVSKCHINPAVTVCALLRGDINVATSAVYVVAQCTGAIIGYGLLRSITPDDVWAESNCCKLCVTTPAPSVSSLQGVLAEGLITSVLIFVVCGVWDKRSANNQDSASLKFGFAIAGLAMVEGHYTGASMNPARSFGPALWNNQWTQHWVYWVGPIGASIISTLFYKYVFERESSTAPEEEHDVPLTSVNSANKKGGTNSSKEDLAL